MQTKIRIAIAHKEYRGSYINRRSDGLTTDLDNAMTFRDMAEASEFLLNNQYAPVDKERYRYAQIKVTKEELEDEPNVQQERNDRQDFGCASGI